MSAEEELGVAALVAEVADLLQTHGRVVVGLAGPPGTGKSTLAAELVAGLRTQGMDAVLVPMDGFHLDQRELERLGRADRKGAPDTFDVAGYVALLRRLREPTDTVVYAPRFDRDLEQSVGSALPVPRTVRVVVTEGNYLLLDPDDTRLPGIDPGDGSPHHVDVAWRDVRDLLDRCWYVDTGDAVRVAGLVARHVAHGRSPHEAEEWVRRNDEANARLVASTRPRADGVVRTRGAAGC